MHILRHVLAALAALAIVPYLVAPVYEFVPSPSFTGDRWYNPYAAWRGPGLRTNLHAHSQAWGGLTHGARPPATVWAAYAARGYRVAALSNYFRRDTATAGESGIVIPTYEHGLNVFKSHRLAIGASRVDWFDVPLGQTTAHKQYLIDRLHESSELVAVVHPALRNGHSVEDLRRLGNYELLEVLNHFGTAEAHWDAALSAGHPVWAIGNDDTHDALDPGQTGVMWTQVGAVTSDRTGVIDALRAGRHVAVASPTGRADVALASLTVTGDTVNVTFSAPVSGLVAISVDGRVIERFAETHHARLTVPRWAPYVRFVATTPAATLYLNPIIRGDGSPPVVSSASINRPATVLQHAVAIGVLGWLATGTRSSRRLGGRRASPRGAGRLAALRRWARLSPRRRLALGRRAIRGVVAAVSPR